MRALFIEAGGAVAIRDWPRPEAVDECLVRVSLAGICGTDLELLRGYAAFRGIPGHEFVGVVERAPARDAHWVGKRVVGEINVGCGHCEWCVRGEKEHCETRTVVGIRDRGGAFAEYVSLPASNLHAIPDHVDDRAAVFVEPIAAACRILEQVTIDPESSIGVVGDGRLGLLIAQVLRTVAGPDCSPDSRATRGHAPLARNVTVLGRHEAKLDVARTLGIRATRVDAPLTDRFDLVVDATGRAEGLVRAIEIVRPRGTIVLKSTFHGTFAAPLWPAVVHEVTIVGSRCGPFAPAIDLLAHARIQTEPLISRVLSLEDYDAAFAAARGSLKVLFQL